MVLRKRACDRCNRLKSVCSGRNPCEGCTKSNINCTFKRPVARIGRPKIQLDKHGQKHKGKYSHSACSNCKVKKKKCDEAWPNCSNCRRLGVECSGPLKIIKWSAITSEGSDSSKDDDIPIQDSSKDDDIPIQDEINEISANGTSINQTSNETSINQTSHGDKPFLNEFNILSPQVNMIELTNDLFGADNELSSREKLFLNSLIRSPTFPIDFDEHLRGPAGGTPARTGGPTSEGPTSEGPVRTEGPGNAGPTSDPGNGGLTDFDHLNGSGPFHNGAGPVDVNQDLLLLVNNSLGPGPVPGGLVPGGLVPKELELMKYFITDVSSLLFVDKASTRFLRTVIPSALADAKVRYPILSIAASHRANSSSHLEHKRDAAIYRGKSQSSFIGTTIDYFETNENILLSVLLIAIQEILEGTSLYWTFAMEKAANIIDKRGGLKKVSIFAPLSIQLFCYLDLISSLSTCSSPYVDNPDLDIYGDDDNSIERILNNKFGFKFGIAGEIFKIIGNISTLSSLRDTRYKSKDNEQRFNTLANLVEMKLQNWSPTLDLVADTYQIDNSMDEGKLILSSFTLALQWSAFLRLHQIRHGYDRTDSRITACLEIILRSVKVISTDSDLETGLMFPLIMAGSVAYKESDRAYIMSRIRSIRQRLKFSYIGEFESLVGRVWGRDEEEGRGVNWARIRYFEFPGLVMF